MNTLELENFFIDAQCHEPPLTIEEIRYILNRKHGEDMSIQVVEEYIKHTQDRASLQKSINEKRANRKAAQLLTDLNMLVSELMDLLDKLKNSDDTRPNKLQVDTLREIRKAIMDIGTMAGELKKQQEVTISHFYVSIDKINEYIEKKKKKWLSEGNDEAIANTLSVEDIEK
jgi:hypothetical protein